MVTAQPPMAAEAMAEREAAWLEVHGIQQEESAAAREHVLWQAGWAAALQWAAQIPAGIIHTQDILNEADVAELAARFRAEWAKGEFKVLPDDGWRRGMEHAAQLADKRAEQIAAAGATTFAHVLADFADLLRNGWEGGGR